MPATATAAACAFASGAVRLTFGAGAAGAGVMSDAIVAVSCAAPVSISSVSPADHARLVEAMGQLPSAMSGALNALDIKKLKHVRGRGLYRLRVGTYRVIYWAVAREIVVLEVDRRDDTTYEHLDRLVVHRRGEGVQVTEVAKTAPAPARTVAGRSPDLSLIHI